VSMRRLPMIILIGLTGLHSFPDSGY
jgi:hypothetical protein